MKNRVISALIYTPLMIAGVILQGWYMTALLAIFMVIATHEMYRALSSAGMKPVRWVGFVFCGLAIIAHIFADTRMALMMCASGMILAMSAVVLKGKIAVQDMIASMMPVMYPGIFFVLLFSLLKLENRAVCTVALVIAIFSTSINDVFALYSGMFFGKHKLSPEISPKKTIEGAIGGLIFCTAFTVAVPALLKLIFFSNPDFALQMEVLPSLWWFIPLGIVISLLAQVGDLTASMIKRHCGIKDFGNIMPGHGGIMDRLDGALFCGAACAIFFRLIGLG
ncbi:MAG: phosphatidate cytidylyltransferase [Clostridia bacterium]|nr:phosphatidate cytidylyltransferase [Clostridia bacterium]